MSVFGGDDRSKAILNIKYLKWQGTAIFKTVQNLSSVCIPKNGILNSFYINRPPPKQGLNMSVFKVVCLHSIIDPNQLTYIGTLAVSPRKFIYELFRKIHQHINENLHSFPVPVFIMAVAISAHSLISVDPVVP